MKRGKFIVFEGLTCSGKTLQAKLLVDYFKRRGKKAIFNNEPTQGFWGRLIRSIVENPTNKMTELERQMIFVSDRGDDLVKTILPNLARGITVVQDRYELSTFAHGMANGLAFHQLADQHKKILGRRYKKPDLTIFIDIDPETAINRLNKSGKRKDIYEALNSARKISAQYKKLIRTRYFGKVAVVDGRRTINRIFIDIKAFFS